MSELLKIKEQTEKIFKIGLSIPSKEDDIVADYNRKIEAYEEANLEFQKEDILFEMRCKKIEKLGFQSFSDAEFVKMLTGEYPDKGFSEGPDRQTNEYFYDHTIDEELKGKKCSWGNKPVRYSKTNKKWFFLNDTKWTIQKGKLNYLRKTIPYGVVLKINELKKLKLFNQFEVYAPIELWEEDIPDIDPIVVGSICVIMERKSKQTKNYFIAQW